MTAPRKDRSWVAKLNAEEQLALQQSEAFFQRRGSRLQRALAKVGRPLDLLLQSSPTGFQNTLNRSVAVVLEAVADGTEATSTESKLFDELCLLAGEELEPWSRIFQIDYRQLQKKAESKLSSAKNTAIFQGGLTGLAGAPGLLADIPSLYFLLFTLVRRIAFCFGFPVESANERRYMMQVVHVGHYLEVQERRYALLELGDLEEEMQNSTHHSEDMQRAILAKTVQMLSRKLTSTLLQRKATQTVALVGGAVGATLNRQLTEDVGWTAIHAYRCRFLKQTSYHR